MCQQFVAQYGNKMAFDFQLTVPFATKQLHSLYASPNRRNTAILGGALRRPGRFFKARLQTELSSNGDIVPTIAVRSQSPQCGRQESFSQPSNSHQLSTTCHLQSSPKLLRWWHRSQKDQGCQRAMAAPPASSHFSRMAGRGALLCLVACLWWFVVVNSYLVSVLIVMMLDQLMNMVFTTTASAAPLQPTGSMRRYGLI